MLLLMDKSNIEHNTSMADFFFANISRSTMYQALKIDHIAVFSLPKRSNGLDLAFGAHRFQEIATNCSHFVLHISQDWGESNG